MTDKLLYERYHKKIKLQKRIISDDDFTYKNTLTKINTYIPINGNVLDIGSATGTLSFYFAAKGLNVDGIEISKNAVHYANLNKKLFKLTNIKFINTSIEKYKSNKKYKLIICFEVLEHLYDDVKALKIIKKYMTSTSILSISVPSESAPLYRLGILNKFDKEVGHLRRYSLQSLEKLLDKTGFKILNKFKTEGVLRSFFFTNRFFGSFLRLTRFKIFNNVLSILDKLMLKLLPESQIIVICKKK